MFKYFLKIIDQKNNAFEFKNSIDHEINFPICSLYASKVTFSLQSTPKLREPIRKLQFLLIKKLRMRCKPLVSRRLHHHNIIMWFKTSFHVVSSLCKTNKRQRKTIYISCALSSTVNINVLYGTKVLFIFLENSKAISYLE